MCIFHFIGMAGALYVCVCEAHFLGSNPGVVHFFSFGFFFSSYQGLQFYRAMLFALCYELIFVVLLIFVC